MGWPICGAVRRPGGSGSVATGDSGSQLLEAWAGAGPAEGWGGSTTNTYLTSSINACGWGGVQTGRKGRVRWAEDKVR
jgi:hypothetical protein